MKKSNNGFDEMQSSKRDRIGSQTFILMFYLLILDMGLYGFGIRWLEYPMNVMIIILVCAILFLVRTIVSNASVPPESKKQKFGIKTILMLIFTVALSAILAFSIQRSISSNSVEAGDNSAVILMVVSGVGFLVVAIVSMINKIRNKDD